MFYNLKRENVTDRAKIKTVKTEVRLRSTLDAYKLINNLQEETLIKK